jgi:alpha-1,3-rhamnosyl/mannosyltransferase
VLAISEATRADFIRLFRVPSEKIVATPLAADAHFAPRPAAEIEAVRHTLGLPDHYLLYFGSNKPHKNLVRLVQAYARLPASTPPLLIAGHWEARYSEAKLSVETQALSQRIKFIGPIAEADLPALYSGATLFVFPSEYEGFGLPVLEALACGVPVACANTSSLPEVAGEAAWLFDPTSVDAIAETVRRALADEAARVERRALGLHRAAQFAWAQTAAQTLAVYQSMTRVTLSASEASPNQTGDSSRSLP